MVPLRDGTRHDMQLLKITLTVDQIAHSNYQHFHLIRICLIRKRNMLNTKG